MRILFTFAGGRGHFEPLVPVARSAAEKGHSVAFGCAPSMVPMVEAAGFAAFALGVEASSPRQRLALRPVDLERENRDLRERFARRAARHRAPLTMTLCKEWKPDVLVCDETDFGAIVAAERLALPFATVLVTASGAFVREDVVGEALDELRAEHGLPPDPGLEMLSRHLVLSPFPPSLRDPAVAHPATARSFRLGQPGSAEDSAPPWPLGLPGQATIYFTLGTIFNTESGDLLARVIIGLRDLAVNLVVTVGRNIDPQELGPQPAHVHVAQYIPQASLLPHCDLVVSHAGSGSVVGALTHGLPSLLIPLGADQPLNAARCADLRVAEVLDGMQVTPESVRAAAARVMDDLTYRRNAERLRDEIAALPEPTHTVGLLEQLAAAGAGPHRLDS